LALPSFVVNWVARNLGDSNAPAVSRTIADLIVLAFFFLLRVGEYTPSSNKDKKTIPLRKQDIRLHKDGRLVSLEADLATLLEADAVTINLANQKNGKKNTVVHHYTSGDPFMDPVKAAARLIFRLHGRDGCTPLGTYVNERGVSGRVTGSAVLAAVRLAAVRCNLADYGYDLKRVGTHSLRSGGATQLKLTGYDDDMVMKLGRWSGPTYLHYIQTQIGEVTRGVATSMARLEWFHNVG
jgi:hypothetical protein